MESERDWVSKTGHEKMRDTEEKTRNRGMEAVAELERKKINILINKEEMALVFISPGKDLI